MTVAEKTMKESLDESKRPVENTLRRIAIYRGYWSLAAQYLRKQEEKRREEYRAPVYSS
jgi:hypothetical protein